MRNKKKEICKIIVCMFLFLSLLILSTSTIVERNYFKEYVSANENNFSSVSEGGDSWSMFHHDLQHTGFSTSDAPDTNNVIWTFDTDSSILWSSPAVVNNRVYIGADNGKVYCLNAIDGAKIWEFSTDGGVQSSPAIDDGKVYFGSNDNKVYCLDAETGSKEWSFTTGDDVKSSPAVDNNRVYIGSHDRRIYCLYTSNGTEIWNTTTTRDWEHSSPIAVNDIVYMHTYALFASNGTIKYGGSSSYIYDASPAYSDGKIFIGLAQSSGSNQIYCFNAEDGSYNWHKNIQNFIYSTPAIFYGNLYIGNWGAAQHKRVYCLNMSDGGEVWVFSVGGIVDSSPAIADGKVYFGSWLIGDKFFCVDASTGLELWNYSTGHTRSSPAIYNSKVFIASESGIIYCFRDNEPPVIPSQPSGSEEGDIELEYTYSTDTTDPEGDDIEYFFDWGDETNSGWIDTSSATHAWFEEGIYEVKVKARDIYDAESEWSDALVVSIINQTSDITQLVITANSTVIEDTNFTVTVKNSTGDEVEGANVKFNGNTSPTDTNGQVTFIAPFVDRDTEFTIIATHEEYRQATARINVLNQEEKKGWIWGTITDYDGEDIEDASVCFALTNEDKTSECTFTDDLGRYHKQVLIGTYTVEASKQGYETVTKQNITVPEGKAIGLDFVLEKSGEELPPDEIQDAIRAGLIGGEITFTLDEGDISTRSKIYSDVSIEPLDVDIAGKEIQLQIGGETSGGQIFLIKIDKEVINFGDEFVVEFDSEVIFSTNNFQDILDALSAGSDIPIYYITYNNEIVLFSPLSVHTITIKQVIVAISIFILLSVYIIIFIAGASAFIYPYLSWPARVRKGKRKKL